MNEDPNVKLIRELRNEIVRLKAMLDGNPMLDAPLVEQSQPETSSIAEEIACNQSRIEEITSEIMNTCEDKYKTFFQVGLDK